MGPSRYSESRSGEQFNVYIRIASLVSLAFTAMAEAKVGTELPGGVSPTAFPAGSSATRPNQRDGPDAELPRPGTKGG